MKMRGEMESAVWCSSRQPQENLRKPLTPPSEEVPEHAYKKAAQAKGGIDEHREDSGDAGLRTSDGPGGSYGLKVKNPPKKGGRQRTA